MRKIILSNKDTGYIKIYLIDDNDIVNTFKIDCETIERFMKTNNSALEFYVNN